MSTNALFKLKQVLVIEDDAAMRDMIATSLRMRGFYVREAADGLAGLRLLEAYDPDVVVLDLGLPIATGFDVVKELRAVAGTRLTPVIAISGFEDQLQQAKESPEFIAALSKPFDPEALIRAVERATIHGPVV
jgi:DNA-binding response OmpR family regulator